MNKFKSILLDTNVVITLENNTVTCVNQDGHSIDLKSGQRKLLGKLAENLNQTVAFHALYNAYAANDCKAVSDGSTNSNITKMKFTFPKEIRQCIVSERNEGYRLKGTIISSPIALSEETARITELAGDYYGFYLDPVGDGTLLNAYLHIENIGTPQEPQMIARIISGIRNHQVLRDPKLTDIMSSKVNPQEAFKEFRDGLRENDKRCSFGSGTVRCEDTLAIVELTMNRGKWELIIDLENYLNGHREKKNKKDFYRGGFGLVLALKGVHGTSCFRIGLVQKDFIKNSLDTGNKRMMEMLKIHDGNQTTAWNPLELDTKLDKHWYSMFMDE